MTDDEQADPQVLNHALPPPLPKSVPVLPLPALSLDAVGPPLHYYRPIMQFGTADWITIARFPTIGKWHQARAALGRGRIEALMGDGEDVAPDAGAPLATDGIALKVTQGNVDRALAILEAVRNGSDWCPRCGSVFLQELRLPWWWMIWSCLFLGIAPFAPPRFACRNCGHRWE